MSKKGKWHSFRVRGVWQQAGSNRRTAGILTVSRDGLHLYLLVDDLDAAAPKPGTTIEFSESTHPSHPITMAGVSDDGRHFVLWDGFFKSGNPWSHIFRTVGRREYFFNAGLEGICTFDPGALSFSKAYATTAILRAWLCANNFNVEHKDNVVLLTGTRPDPIRFPIDEGRTVCFRYSRSGPSMRLHQTSGSIRIRPQLGIEYTLPVSLATCHHDLTVLIDLLQLLSGSPVVYRQLTLTSPDAARKLRDGSRLSDELKFLSSQMEAARSHKIDIPNALLFSLPGLQDRFANLIRSWWELYETASHVLLPYFAIRRWNRSFSNERFFVAATAAEAIHSLLYPTPSPLTRAEWKAIRTSLRQALALHHMEHLLPKLSHIARPTFVERIEALVLALPTDLRELVLGEGTAQDKFVRRVKTLRNAEAHRTKLKGLEEPFTGLQFARLAHKLQVLVDHALWTKLGLGQDEIMKAIEHCEEYKFYAYNSSWPWDIA